MNISDLGAHVENPLHDEVPEPERAAREIENAASLFGAIRGAAVKAQATDIRERLVATILDAVGPIDIDYPAELVGLEAEISAHVAGVARFVTGLADALGVYIVTGHVAPITSEEDEPEGTEV